MLEIAVIGAGAAGLVASRQLWQCGLRPFVFDVARMVGGAWSDHRHQESGDRQGTGGIMWDGLHTNLSRFTCRFSDAPWPNDAEVFPSSNEMDAYLRHYHETTQRRIEQHVANGDDESSSYFRFGCWVTKVSPQFPIAGVSRSNQESSVPRYKVEWLTREAESGVDAQAGTGDSWTRHSRTFDGVVVASGFFSKPFLPEALSQSSKEGARIFHSSQYRSPQHHDITGDTIVAVIGGSFSALEIAADVAPHAKRLIHVMPRVPYVLPRWIGKPLVPIDVALYRRQTDAPKVPQQLVLSEEDCQRRHQALRKMLEETTVDFQGNKNMLELHQSAIGIPQDDSVPHVVAISDGYLQRVLDGSIQVVHGRVKRTDGYSIQVSSAHSSVQTIDGIDTIIACTGFRSDLDSFLDGDILKALDYDVNNRFCPITACYDALLPNVPNFGMVGMYRGPYMGIMELQSKIVANFIAQGSSSTMDAAEVEEALRISRTIRQQPNHRKSSFPHFDYVGHMDRLARACGRSVSRYRPWGQAGGLVSPAFYHETTDDGESSSNNELAQECWNEMMDVTQRSAANDGSGSDNSDDDEPETAPNDSMASKVLRALVGRWTFERSICHFNDNDRRESVTGDIAYSKLGTAPSLELSYREDGLFHLPTRSLQVFREYEYVHNTEESTLDIYFVEDGQRAHLFLKLRFSAEFDGEEWTATSDHLCVKDLYTGTFRVCMSDDGNSATRVSMTYRVRGPNKDYEATTILRPKTT